MTLHSLFPVLDGSSHGGAPDVTPQGVMSLDECRKIFDRCVALARPGGEFHVNVSHWWVGGVQWARNRAFLAKDVHRTFVNVFHQYRGKYGLSSTTQLDDAGLRDLMQRVDRSVEYDAHTSYDTRAKPKTELPMLRPTLWSDATYRFDGERRGELVRSLLESAEAAGLWSAGELRVQARMTARFGTDGITRYYPTTRVVFSTTVRDRKGTGSGWAGTDDFDVARVDMRGMASRALDKCVKAVNPVAIEPGYYTAILEPQAVADLWAPLMSTPQVMERGWAEQPVGPFGLRRGYSKIGQRVLDPRLTVSADPMDPLGGFLPFGGLQGTPYYPASWIDQGVLRQLAYDKFYALANLGLETPLENSYSWRMSGGTTSTDEMIATTKRGLLVTRFHGVECRDLNSFTCSGYTRDGVWLIENGKITKPVKNFRFVESPLFVFNKLEQLGAAQRVFANNQSLWGDERAWIAPTLKVRDFNFSQLADAV